ncbi:MAG: hypothetical protein IJ719_00425 [Clostridia bacterium]|nr:hypothetical protein [Clostridia bacterium]
MAERILVDIPTMEATISAYNTAKTNLDVAITKMRSAVDKIEWKGQAANDTRAEFTTLVENLKKSEGTMDKAVGILRTVINEMQLAEQNASSIGKTLDKGEGVKIPL